MSTSPKDFAVTAKTLAVALAEACFDPADAIRLLKQLGAYVPVKYHAPTVIGTAAKDMETATGDLFRRMAIIAMARVSATYQPSSYDDAIKVRDTVCNALEEEITRAADQGDDDVYDVLRALKTAVAQDLKIRGADLARVRTFHVPKPSPSIALAHKHYNNTSRGEELEVQADVRHPMFMPTKFTGLTD